jgi:hypothetical protein
MAQPAAAAPPAAAAGMMEEEPAKAGGARRWILAGCGCLLLLAICGGAFYVLDTFYPDILYAPLRAIGL